MGGFDGYEIKLNDVGGVNGFRITSMNDTVITGGGIGDINGDKFSEIAISTLNKYTGIQSAYVIFGSNKTSINFDLSAIDGNNGFRIYGSDHQKIGVGITSADFNDDGLYDVVLGSTDTNSTSAYVLFGQRTFDREIDVNSGDSLKITGVFDPYILSSGDFNGDNVDDIITSRHVIFGSSAIFPAEISVDSLDGSNGFTINCLDCTDTTNAGDFNNDGIDDIIISESIPMRQGSIYMIFGRKTYQNEVNVNSLDGSNGFKMIGSSPQEWAGCDVNGVGDINGDSISDVVISACPINTNVHAYVVFGSNKPFPTELPLSSLNGRNGFAIIGSSNDQYYVGVDFNGDGINDLLTYDYDRGTNWILLGRSNFHNSQYQFSELESVKFISNNGFLSFGSIDDFNQDGFQDVVLARPEHDSEEEALGYVVYGRSIETKSSAEDHLWAIIGGVVGAVAVTAGVVIYGKYHGWCGSEGHTMMGDGYVLHQNEADL